MGSVGANPVYSKHNSDYTTKSRIKNARIDEKPKLRNIEKPLTYQTCVGTNGNFGNL